MVLQDVCPEILDSIRINGIGDTVHEVHLCRLEVTSNKTVAPIWIGTTYHRRSIVGDPRRGRKFEPTLTKAESEGEEETTSRSNV